MTWIVGLTGLRTCGVLVGDVRVTALNGRIAFDGVQKVHLVNESTAVGFAGSVRCGLRVVDDLRRHSGAYLAPRGVRDFGATVERWARRVRHSWQRDLPELEPGIALHLIVMTARRMPGSGDVEALLGVAFATATAYVLKSPHFEIETVTGVRATAIGSGRAYERLTEELSGIEAEIPGLWPFEVQDAFRRLGGPAMPVRAVLSNAIAGVNPRDVSEHLHAALVAPAESTVLTFDMGPLSPGGEVRRMPAVATTEAEFETFARRHHVADAVA